MHNFIDVLKFSCKNVKSKFFKRNILSQFPYFLGKNTQNLKRTYFVPTFEPCGHVVETCCHLMLNPSWDTFFHMTHNIKNLKKKEKHCFHVYVRLVILSLIIG